MPVDVIVGGQGGDEGKGKIAAYLSLHDDYDICMRVSSPQAGHSIYYKGARVGLALLPSGVLNEKSRLLIGAGGLISLEKIDREIAKTDLDSKRLGIDYMVTIVTSEHKKKEKENEYLMKEVGSVGEGISSCRIEKIMRNPELLFAKDCPLLKPYLADTKSEVHKTIELGGKILLEGDHGAKLDLIHGEYPKVTSRAVNASGFLSEAGIGPRHVQDVYVVLKPYVTRVGPGPLEKEMLDEKILEWTHSTGGETGTVSKRLRRIGEFEWENVKTVIKMNSATKIALTHMDCPDFFWNAMGFKDQLEFIRKFEEEICDKWPYPKITLLSYGPKIEDVEKY
ncbi:adenylosuccinate synthetase [Candidatus Pacearchaeota archaeon]|nr:adenylosuccinate synthetase [Candidatus Pacearchaeota archaeon]